jgi:SpoVK/Ycf46/Vps4 family AAA+-type ATPase
MYDAVSQGRMLFIATCNSIASLPPELRRRFTLGTFFFDLPTEEEREIIWQIYFKKYGVTGELPNDEGWTGAEIKECCRKAHRLGMTLVQAAKYIVPVARSAAEQVKALRQMASGKFISASTPGVYQYQENQSVPSGRIIRDLEGPLTVMPPSRTEAWTHISILNSVHKSSDVRPHQYLCRFEAGPGKLHRAGEISPLAECEPSYMVPRDRLLARRGKRLHSTRSICPAAP